MSETSNDRITPRRTPPISSATPPRPSRRTRTRNSDVLPLNHRNSSVPAENRSASVRQHLGALGRVTSRVRPRVSRDLSLYNGDMGSSSPWGVGDAPVPSTQPPPPSGMSTSPSLGAAAVTTSPSTTSNSPAKQGTAFASNRSASPPSSYRMRDHEVPALLASPVSGSDSSPTVSPSPPLGSHHTTRSPTIRGDAVRSTHNSMSPAAHRAASELDADVIGRRTAVALPSSSDGRSTGTPCVAFGEEDSSQQTPASRTRSDTPQADKGRFTLFGMRRVKTKDLSRLQDAPAQDTMTRRKSAGIGQGQLGSASGLGSGGWMKEGFGGFLSLIIRDGNGAGSSSNTKPNKRMGQLSRSQDTKRVDQGEHGKEKKPRKQRKNLSEMDFSRDELYDSEEDEMNSADEIRPVASFAHDDFIEFQAGRKKTRFFQ